MDQRPIAAQAHEPLFKTAADRRVEIMDMSLNRRIEDDRVKKVYLGEEFTL